jgi:hypothetical protein
MTSTNWKEIVHEGIVKYMPENAQFKNGVPNIAAITRAGIAADESGEYNNPRVFTNEEIQRQVGLIHRAGTPMNCIRWYRTNPGPRKASPRAGFKEAYALFKEQGKSIPQEALAEIAEANLHIIFGVRGADLTKLSEFGIMENFRIEMEKRKQETIAAKLEKARAARDAKKAKAEAAATVEVTVTEVKSETEAEKKPAKKLKLKK